MKNHPIDPQACDGIEETAGTSFRLATSQKNVPIPGGRVALIATAALLLKDGDAFRAKQVEIEKILEDCSRQAEEEVNRKRLGGGKPVKEDCDKAVGNKPNGDPITQAMRWGLEKHKAARACAEKKLGQLVPGSFSLEQRYRFETSTGRTSLVSQEERDILIRQGREKELEGTLEPDVVIHSGDPLQAWAVYDFKFPCPETNPPMWSRYQGNRTISA